MTGAVATRLKEMGIELPPPAPAAANYVPWMITGDTLYIAGQLPSAPGADLVTGRLGDGVSVTEGAQAARLCALNILAQAQAALDGDFDRIAQCAKLGGFVNATPDFTDHPQVINGASDLFVEILGERGKHARFAVGAPSLPFGAAVEIDAIFNIG